MLTADYRSSMREILQNIWITIWNLPRPIRRVCYVQLFAFMGWFPFLFYSCVSPVPCRYRVLIAVQDNVH